MTGFGSSVAVSGNVAIVGAYLDDDNGTNSGSVYVFRFNGATWVQEQKLTASDGAAADFFGYSVALSGNVAVVGAYADDGSGTNSGSAYLFRYNGSTWVEETKLLASDGAASDFFGVTVAVSGDVAVVGAHADDDSGANSGSAYVFGFNGSSWNQEAKLLAADGAAGDRFGRAVAVWGDVAVVGARDDDDHGTNSGSAYVFRFNGSSWTQDAKLLASDGAAYDRLGHSVAVSGGVAVVGAYWDDDDPFQDSGSAYVFRFNGSAWIEETKLLAPDRYFWDFFGYSVSVDDEVAVVGAFSEDSQGTDSGSAYFFASAGAPDGCTADSECDDFNACTTDSCMAGMCSNTPIDCNDGSVCTADSCDPASGCLNDPISCDDSNLCTIDSCDSQSGCVFDPIICPAGESCVNGICEPDGCTSNSDCDDANACTGDVCSNGTCSNLPLSCNDGNACTADSCDAASGCVSDPISCDDSNLCTIDSCDWQSGCVFEPIICPAGETCVSGTCVPSSECTFDSDCSDGDGCTIDTCDGGTCSNVPVFCNDGNACTVDTCIPTGGCLFDPIDCPPGQTCVDGGCAAADGCAFNSDCNDFDACTTDLCNSGTCSNTPITCDDSDACTVDSCSGGTCFFAPINCDDADACSVDTCSGGVCSHDPMDCDDGDACTVDGCSGGVCFADPISCDDGDACTDDMCFDGLCENTFLACGLEDGCCGPDCDGGSDPDCPTCLPAGSSCTDNAECCSNKCKGKNGNKSCKGN